MITRRNLFLTSAAAGLSGCTWLDGLNSTDSAMRAFFQGAERLSMTAQRALMGDRLAPEFTEADIRQSQHPNGSVSVDSPEYLALQAGGFAGYALQVTGLVETPLSIPYAELTALPARTQITRHDCVEGWSAIAKWTGVPVKFLLDRAGLKPEARYIVFHCADANDGSPYYESFDLLDAYHPQTILAWNLNDEPLPVPNGAPLRLRVERQLGYKHAKYVQRIEAVASLKTIYGGKGGFWEDGAGYEWYAGA